MFWLKYILNNSFFYYLIIFNNSILKIVERENEFIIIFFLCLIKKKKKERFIMEIYNGEIWYNFEKGIFWIFYFFREILIEVWGIYW